MNIYLYVSIVTLVGSVVAYILGRQMNMLSGFGAFFAFLGLSIVLGAFLAFGVWPFVSLFCSLFGISSGQCINTNDRTVWYLAVPFVAAPAYLVCMFIGRTAARSQHGGSDQHVP